MLVLARRLNERIVIPCIRATIQVVKIQGGLVRLGIEAPPDVHVLREEVAQDERADKSAVPPPGDDFRRRLGEAAHSLAMLRRRLRGQLPPAAAAALFRIDRELGDLARRADGSPAAPGTTLTVPAAP